MSYYLIGIGGTGARCMEAFVHLNGAGLLKDRQDVELVYVDADKSCGNLQKTKKAVDLYCRAKELGFSSHQIFVNSVHEDDWVPGGDTSKTLDDALKTSADLEGDSSAKGAWFLYKSLFTEQERRTNLDMGFRGHPSIGAVIMNASMDPDVSPWKELLPKINNDKDAKIFLFASVFGGTGAAGFPTIAKLLTDSLKKDGDGKSIAKIGGALVLPYFDFPPAEGKDKDEMQAKVDEFMLNTKSALDYYYKNGYLGEIFTSIYVMGDDQRTAVKTFALGAGGQTNPANIIEAYAALAAFDFFNENKYDGKFAPMIARRDNNRITWEDIPDVCRDGTTKERLSTYIRFLYVYRNAVFPKLQEIAKNSKTTCSWYIDLVQKAGKIDLYKDKELIDGAFKGLADYSEQFFAWIGDIITNSNRNIELINRDIYQSGEYEASFNLDAYQIVLPIVEREDKLSRKKVEQDLSEYKIDSTTANGAGILLEALVEICRNK